MLVSIVVPIYRSEAYIEKCVRSLFEQTYHDIEYIFVDDGSDDGSIEILNRVKEDYHLRSESIKIISHQINRGSAMARETGLTASTGEYVIQVDSDDITTRRYIELLVNSAMSHNADVTICDICYAYDGGKKEVLEFGEMCKDATTCLSNILSGKMHNSLCNKLIKRSLFVENDIHFVEGLNMFDDKSVIFKVLYYSNNISYVNSPLYIYNKTNPHSITSQAKINEIVPALKVARIIDDFFVTHHVSHKVRRGKDLFKCSVAGLILCHGKISEYKNDLIDLGPFTVGNYLFDSIVPLHYKLVIILYQIRFYPAIKLLQKIVGKIGGR